MSKEHLKRAPKPVDQTPAETPPGNKGKTEPVYWRDPSLPAGYDLPSEESETPPAEESWPDDEDRYLGGFFD